MDNIYPSLFSFSIYNKQETKQQQNEMQKHKQPIMEVGSQKTSIQKDFQNNFRMHLARYEIRVKGHEIPKKIQFGTTLKSDLYPTATPRPYRFSNPHLKQIHARIGGRVSTSNWVKSSPFLHHSYLNEIPFLINYNIIV